MPDTPSTINQGDLASIQDQLNVYLAWEAGVRSQVSEPFSGTMPKRTDGRCNAGRGQ